MVQQDIWSTLYDTKPNYLVIVITLILATIILRKILTFSKYAKYPPFATGLYLPWLGHVTAFIVDPVEFCRKQYHTIGDAVSFVLFGHDIVLLSGPKATEAFYNAPEETLAAKEAYKFMTPAFGPGVVYDCPDEKFQHQRKMAAGALSLKAFKSYVPKLINETENYLKEKWGESGQIDFYQVTSEITILTSTCCLQGPEIRAQVHTGYSNYMHDIDQALTPLGFFFPNLPLPNYKSRDIARRKLGAMVKAVIAKRRKEEASGEKKEYDDVLESLLNSTYPDGTKYTENDVTGLLVALMLAGQHTSNVTISWLAINTLSDPQIKKRLLEEVERVFCSGKEVDFDALKEMEFFENCLKESLRLRPPIILVFRQALKNFTYDKYEIPQGTLVATSPACFSCSEKSPFTDPLSFNPDRFSREQMQDKKERYSYYPFSLGRHACIGEKFAYLQIKTVFSTMLKYYDLELVGSRSDYQPDYTTLMAGPKGQVKVNYRRKRKIQ